MKPYLANLIYAVLLIAVSLWGYLGSESPSGTAFIPTAFGLILLALTPGMKKENKIISHIVVVLTFILMIALLKPFTAALGREDNMAIARILVMMVWGLVAFVIYIKSFVDARKQKA